MTRSIFVLLLLAACNSDGVPDGETGLDINNVDDSDAVDTDRPDTDIDDEDTDDTSVAVGDTAFESDTDLEDTDVADTDSGVLVDPDNDGDGYPASTDCNDANQDVRPNAQEVCNDVDDDCDGLKDEGTNDGITYHRDQDGDSFGSATVTTRGCGAPAGFVVDGTDCNDNVQTTHPGADELCNGVDDNCFGGFDEDPVDGSTYYIDNDDDSYGDASVSVVACTTPRGYADNATDCDDTLPGVNPGATEVCNGVDDNCSNSVDEGVKLTFYLDSDFDDYGDVTSTTQACTAPSGYVADHTDCDDSRDTTHPNATEVCNGVDDNCVGGTDEGVKLTFYADADRDHYGNASVTVSACTAPFGYVADGTDCNDTIDYIHPEAPETNCADPVDYNCDGSTGYADADGDNVPACEDCDDHAVAVFPGAVEVCNGVDDNCFDGIDEGLTTRFYADTDNDTYGDPGNATDACTLPDGYAVNATDCDDTRASVHPGATEVCNNRDDNCTNGVDEGVKLSFYPDADSDTYGDLTGTVQACTQPQGYVVDHTDCDDSAFLVHPGAPEVCNGKDDNCTNGVDEGVKTTFYADVDSDLFGDPESTAAACSVPSGYVANSNDCDDTRAIVHPGATEVCDELDNNCVNGVDEGVQITFYGDADGDLYGDLDSPGRACFVPEGFTLDSTDCDDTVAAIHPNATEICNTVDDDCDTLIDEGVKTTFYADQDHDTYGNTVLVTQACVAPPNYVLDHTDCDDSAASVHPNATETCNGVDDDCSATADDHIAASNIPLSAKQAGVCQGAKKVCDGVNGFVEPNYSLIANYESVEVSCDTKDNDCDASVDEGVKSTFYADLDGDHYGNASSSQQACSAPANTVTDHTDCDDARSFVFPGAPEVCDELDNNCNTVIDENATDATLYYADADGDGFGTGTGTASCDEIPTLVSQNGDCDDEDKRIYPGAFELCDGQKNDCDGVGWSSADEEGLVSVEKPNGDWYDDTTLFTGAYELPEGTVHICPGTYDVELTPSPIGSTTVKGEGAADAVTLSGDGAHRVLAATYGDVSLATLTVDGGHSEGPGGCVFVDDATLTANGVVFTNCVTPVNGGAIYVGPGGTVSLNGGEVSWSSAGGVEADGGGGGGVESYGTLSLDGVSVHDNYAQDGYGGGVLAQAGLLDMQHSTFAGNGALYGGGLALMLNANSSIYTPTGLGSLTGPSSAPTHNYVDVNFNSNVAIGSGGAVYQASFAPMTFEDSLAEGNSASEDGGAFYVSYSNLTLTRVTVSSGGAEYGGGGVALLHAYLTLNNAAIENNSSGGFGGGLSADYSNLSAIDTKFEGNTAAADSARGGGLYLQSTPATLLGGSIMTNQSLNRFQALDINSLGGGLYAVESAVRLAYTTVSSNMAWSGGGVWFSNAEGGELELAGTTSIFGNYAFYGGGLYVDSGRAKCGTVPDDSVSIVANTSNDPNTGAGVFLNGAPSYLDMYLCNMGDSSGPEDNVSGGYVNQDVTTDAGTYPFGFGATELCNGAYGCGPL